MGADVVARFGDPAHRQPVDSLGTFGVRLARVDGCPRRAVDDDVWPPRARRLQYGGAIGDVEIAVREGKDLVPLLLGRGDDIVTELTAGAGDESPHVQAVPSATGARSRSGCHHCGFAAYQSIVAVMPLSQSICGSQPSSVRIFDQSRT